MLNERKLTGRELDKRIEAIQGLLSNKRTLVKKYGKDAEKVMYGIATKQAKSKVEVGLSPEEEIVQDSLKAAMDAAQALGSDKLADQIGNTITFFTRQFVVGDNTD